MIAEQPSLVQSVSRAANRNAGCTQADAACLIRNLPAAHVLVRLSDECVIVESEASLRLFGCRKTRTGVPLSRFWPSQSAYREFMRPARAETSIERYEARLQRNSGEQFWCAVSTQQIQIDGQSFLFLYVHDLTEQIAARDELSRRTDALHDAEKLSALGQVLGGISHELNNPLSVLAGQALMLKEKATDAATERRADRIFNAANRCSRIVRSFLDLARGKPADPVAVNLADLVAEAIELRIESLRREGIDVVLELPKKLPRILVDPDQVRQVIANLVSNAEHALRGVSRTRRISIVARHAEAERSVSLTVTDTGTGVPSDVSSRIFDPLFSTKSPGEGTGLGLALCRRIMEVHGGTIALAPTSTAGASFRLTFARLAGGALSFEPILRRPATARGGRNVLLIDDASGAARDVSERIAQMGHGIELVQTAYVALERLRRIPFDVILCRVDLGDSGVTSQIRAFEKVRPGSSQAVIFISGRNADATILDQLDQAERPYLIEPVRDRDLRESIELMMLRPAA